MPPIRSKPCALWKTSRACWTWPCSAAACTSRWTTSDATVARIRQALGAKGIEVERLEPIQPSMEDVFVALIEAEERKAA